MSTPRKKLRKENGNWFVNNSGLCLIQTCPRKAQYIFDKPETNRDNLAQSFGRAIHAALESFYMTPVEERNDSLVAKMHMSFLASANDLIRAVPEGDPRSIQNGTAIINNFFKLYKDDAWEIYTDEKGPFVERDFEVQVTEGLIFFGTIDLVLQHRETKQKCVVDHKTARSLSGFQNKPLVSHQISGYMWALQKMGVDVSMGMLQGFQAAKTKQDVMRVYTHRSKEQLDEWLEWVGNTVFYWDRLMKFGNPPMNGDQACTQFGACQYLPVCSAPKNMRENILNQLTPKESEE